MDETASINRPPFSFYFWAEPEGPCAALPNAFPMLRAPTRAKGGDVAAWRNIDMMADIADRWDIPPQHRVPFPQGFGGHSDPDRWDDNAIGNDLTLGINDQAVAHWADWKDEWLREWDRSFDTPARLHVDDLEGGDGRRSPRAVREDLMGDVCYDRVAATWPGVKTVNWRINPVIAPTSRATAHNYVFYNDFRAEEHYNAMVVHGSDMVVPWIMPAGRGAAQATAPVDTMTCYQWIWTLYSEYGVLDFLMFTGSEDAPAFRRFDWRTMWNQTAKVLQAVNRRWYKESGST